MSREAIPDDIFAAMAEGQRSGAIPKSPEVVQVFEFLCQITGTRRAWSVAKLEEAARRPGPTAVFPTSEATTKKCGIDEAYARSTPDHRLKEPGIAVTIRVNGQLLNVLADGNHRAFELHRRGVPGFPVRVLSEEESAACEIEPDALNDPRIAQRIK